MSKLSTDSLFSDYPALDYFMRTNNYWAHYHTHLPSLVVNNLRPRLASASGALRILDIGCGTGELSIPIFEELSRYHPVEITAFDPSARAVDAYRNTYSESIHRSVLNEVSIDTIQTFLISDRFDLILAAHSLYEPFETSSDRSRTGSEIYKKLTALAAETGLICVIMASSDSMVYEFKREAYILLGKPQHFMMTAETFDELLELRINKRRKYVADTYMDVSDFFAAGSDAERPSQWLSYLLRIKFDDLSIDLKQCLLSIIRNRALRFASLPEVLISEYKLCHSPLGVPTHDTRILLHKESIILFRKSEPII